MNKLLITVLFAFSMNALAETAQLGENQNPPSKTTAGGCSFARTKKVVATKTASKTESKKSSSMDVKN